MNGPALLGDPATVGVARLLAAVVLTVSAWGKFASPLVFQGVVADYRILPERLVPGFARALPVLETVAAALLVVPALSSWGAGLAAALTVAVSGAVAVNLLRGRRSIECGCGGARGQTISPGLLVRNGALLAVIGVAAATRSARPFAALDLFTAAAGATAFAGLYFAATQLLANAAALAPGLGSR